MTLRVLATAETFMAGHRTPLGLPRPAETARDSRSFYTLSPRLGQGWLARPRQSLGPPLKAHAVCVASIAYSRGTHSGELVGRRHTSPQKMNATRRARTAASGPSGGSKSPGRARPATTPPSTGAAARAGRAVHRPP